MSVPLRNLFEMTEFDHLNVILNLPNNDDAANLTRLQTFAFDNAELLESYFVNNCFELFLQPIVNEFGVVIKFEVLIRLVLAGKIYAPSSFLPFIQRHGFIEALDEYVLKKTLRLLSSDFWQTEIQRCSYRFAINISPSSNNVYQHIQNLLSLVKNSNLALACLEFEITEGALIHNAIQDERILMDVAQLLHENNILPAMDDFGVKNSSFERLIACDFDSIKIDMYVVSQLMDEGYSGKSAKIILRSLLGLAVDLELDLIVEGVANKELYLVLRELGCRMFQGYYFSEPLSIKEVEGLILSGQLDPFDKVIL